MHVRAFTHTQLTRGASFISNNLNAHLTCASRATVLHRLSVTLVFLCACIRKLIQNIQGGTIELDEKPEPSETCSSLGSLIADVGERPPRTVLIDLLHRKNRPASK